MVLTDLEKTTLLRTARMSIAATVLHQQYRRDATVTPTLELCCGAFVTLHRSGELRGCIGFIEGVYPLLQTIEKVAPKAAIEDPRFQAVSPDELDDLEIEISVMSPLESVTDVSVIEPGRDGLLVECGNRRGLLLPQVAEEYGWDREEFLQHTCIKARLAPDAWARPDTRIYRFTVILFSESEFTRRER